MGSKGPSEPTPRDRWLATFKLEPVDRIPFWPKIFGSWTRWHGAPYSEMDINTVHETLGTDNHVFLWPPPLKEVRQNTTKEVIREDGVQRTIYRTPHGSTEMVQHWDELSQSMHPVIFPIRTEEDLDLMIEHTADCHFELDIEALANQQERVDELGDRGVTADSVGRSPLMHTVEFLAGVEDSHFLLHDHREKMEKLFGELQRLIVESCHILCEHSPADILYMVEDTSTTLISPTQYQRYCMDHLSEVAAIAREADRNLFLHMCGEVKRLLPDIAELDVTGWEALTSPPVGNTRFAESRDALPTFCLIGGTNAALWVRPTEEIIAEIERDLDAMPHHRGVVVSSAGVLPPECSPETLKAVRAWLADYPVRV